jgi:hypothetical protein
MVDAREYGLPETVSCPFCEGVETELHSPFGTALSVATYWCRSCRTAFEWVKWGERTDQPPSTSTS